MDKNGHNWLANGRCICPYTCEYCGALSGTDKAGKQCEKNMGILHDQNTGHMWFTGKQPMKCLQCGALHGSLRGLSSCDSNAVDETLEFYDPEKIDFKPKPPQTAWKEELGGYRANFHDLLAWGEATPLAVQLPDGRYIPNKEWKHHEKDGLSIDRAVIDGVEYKIDYPGVKQS